MNQQVNSALARKLSAGQDMAVSNGRSVLRAFRLALARAADECLNLPLAVIGAKQTLRAPTDLDKVISDDWLLLVFASESGTAAICLDPGCVSAIVQMQTIGQVAAAPPNPRQLTDTDAAMSLPLIEDMLNRAQTLVDGPQDPVSLSGLAFASRVPDRRSVGLALTEDNYTVFDLTVEIAGGARQGQICALLPNSPEAESALADDTAMKGPNLDQAAGAIRAELHSVTCRMSLPLAKLSELQVGDVLPLTGARLDRTEITTIDGTRTAVGRLGQCGGMRAVRINEQMSLPELTDASRHEFKENETRAHPADLEVDIIPPDEPTPQEPSEIVPLDQSAVNYVNSDKMVAEISELAGLKDRTDDSNFA
ncbi:flagellar motor switch protein FliM [Ruegeria sp. ANG-S4]|uniref:flagellar motor switch protein FliM n=1 Tax=Ruegeria sp. ANG-S4 TaxID=1577904 RepID=UPI00068B414D|nr:flagellar motor switch protein FliM [Ruegeria sp. ANG-S4]